MNVLTEPRVCAQELLLLAQPRSKRPQRPILAHSSRTASRTAHRTAASRSTSRRYHGHSRDRSLRLDGGETKPVKRQGSLSLIVASRHSPGGRRRRGHRVVLRVVPSQARAKCCAAAMLRCRHARRPPEWLASPAAMCVHRTFCLALWPDACTPAVPGVPMAARDCPVAELAWPRCRRRRPGVRLWCDAQSVCGRPGV